MWPILLIGAGVLAYNAFQVSQLVDQLQLKFNRFDLVRKGSNIFSTALRLQVDLINPTPGSITVTSLSGRVIVNGSEVGTFNYLQPFTIPPVSQGGRKSLDISAIANNASVLTTLVGFLTNFAAPAIKLVMTVNALGASFTSEIPLTEGKKLQVVNAQ